MEYLATGSQHGLADSHDDTPAAVASHFFIEVTARARS